MAGSVRRMKPEVGDIEIVAKPALIQELDLFGDSDKFHSALDDFNFSEIGTVIKGGSKYKQIALTSGINLDLFIVLYPAQWGVIFMIRTGSAEFSKAMVTQKKFGGHLPSYCVVRDGAVWDKEGIICMDEEQDYFKLCGMDFVPPEKRNV